MAAANDVDLALEWSSRTDSQLFEGIGSWLIGDALPAAPDQKQRRIDAGRQWWERTLRAIQDEICMDPRVVAARYELDTNQVRLVQVLIDIYGKKAGYPPAATLVGLILKIGLDRICPVDGP